MSITYHFDLYPRDDPKDGTKLVRFTKLQLAEYRGDAHGTGAGKFSIRATDTEAAFIDPDGLQYVRVVRDDGSTEVVVGGFFIDAVDYGALDPTGKQLLLASGAGTLSYLDRAVMWSHSYLELAKPGGGTISGQDPFDDIWRLDQQWDQYGYSGDVADAPSLGGMLWRALNEAQSFDAANPSGDDRPESALPALTYDFDWTRDSSDNLFTDWAGEYRPTVGTSLLSVVKALMERGLYISMDPDTFVLSAWEDANHGRDRTGAAWGASVVRFQAPSAATVATGNIKSDAKRAIAAKIRRSALLAGGQDTYGLATAVSDVPWEGFYSSDAADQDSNAAVATVQLDARDDAGDTLRLRMKLASDVSNGKYLPFEDVLLDDTVTVHSGSGEWDWNEAEFPVAGITLKLRPSGDWDAWVDLGSTYIDAATREFRTIGTPSHTHPPNPRLCDPATIVDLKTDGTWKALVLGYRDSGGSLVVENAEPAGWKLTGFDDSAWDAATETDVEADYVKIRHADGAAFRKHEEHLLRKEFFLNSADLTGADVTFKHYFDNGGKVYVNGSEVASSGTPFSSTTPAEVSTTIARSYFVAGLNTVAVYLWNEDGGTNGSTPPGAMKAGVFMDLPTGDPTPGTSNEASRCDHGHLHNDLVNRNATGAHDADAIDAPDPGNHFTGTTVGAQLQELGAGTSGSFVTVNDGGKETVNTVAASGAAETIDLANGNVHDVTLTDDCTLTFAGATAGVACSFTLLARQDGTGSRLVTWPAAVEWPDDTAPTLSTDANAVDILTFLTLDGGTTWFGQYAGSQAAATPQVLYEPLAVSDGSGGFEPVYTADGRFIMVPVGD